LAVLLMLLLLHGMLHCRLQVSYRKLLDVFFNRVDPTTLNRQGNDRGTQYRSAIYTHDEEQLQEAQQKIAEVNQQLSQVGGCAAVEQ
jgi:peptide methionine sulfoxide reductase MsrA